MKSNLQLLKHPKLSPTFIEWKEVKSKASVTEIAFKRKTYISLRLKVFGVKAASFVCNCLWYTCLINVAHIFSNFLPQDMKTVSVDEMIRKKKNPESWGLFTCF